MCACVVKCWWYSGPNPTPTSSPFQKHWNRRWSTASPHQRTHVCTGFHIAPSHTHTYPTGFSRLHRKRCFIRTCGKKIRSKMSKEFVEWKNSIACRHSRRYTHQANSPASMRAPKSTLVKWHNPHTTIHIKIQEDDDRSERIKYEKAFVNLQVRMREVHATFCLGSCHPLPHHHFLVVTHEIFLASTLQAKQSAHEGFIRKQRVKEAMNEMRVTNKFSNIESIL